MADLLIKGINDISAPHDIHIINIGLNGAKKGFSAWDSSVGCAYEVVEVPAHGPLIDARMLYEKTAELEAQALHQVRVSDEWEKWSIILTERTAFKYDVADAPIIIEASEGDK